MSFTYCRKKIEKNVVTVQKFVPNIVVPCTCLQAYSTLVPKSVLPKWCKIAHVFYGITFKNEQVSHCQNFFFSLRTLCPYGIHSLLPKYSHVYFTSVQLMKKVLSTVVRLYSLLLFRLYTWIRITEPYRKPVSDGGLIFRATFTLHICLWLNVAVVLGIIRFLTHAQFDPTLIMGLIFFLIPMVAYIVDYKGENKRIVNKMCRQLNEGEEERKNAKRTFNLYVIGSFALFVLTGAANVSLNKAQHIEEIKSTPEYQQMQESSRERQKWHEQRKREREEKMFQRLPEGIREKPHKDSL